MKDASQAAITAAYQKEYQHSGESPKSLLWLSYRSAVTRYRALVESIDIEGSGVLDAGCGMGDLLPYLYAKSLNFNYHGVDITPEFIDVAKKRYDGEFFTVGNPFDESFSDRYDVVLSCGVMNHDQPDWLEKRKAMITKLFSLTKHTLAFNMAGYWGNSSVQPPIAYANAQEILNFCTQLSDSLQFKNNYHPQDFTIIMQR